MTLRSEVWCFAGGGPLNFGLQTPGGFGTTCSNPGGGPNDLPVPAGFDVGGTKSGGGTNSKGRMYFGSICVICLSKSLTAGFAVETTSAVVVPWRGVTGPDSGVFAELKNSMIFWSVACRPKKKCVHICIYIYIYIYIYTYTKTLRTSHHRAWRGQQRQQQVENL